MRFVVSDSLASLEDVSIRTGIAKYFGPWAVSSADDSQSFAWHQPRKIERAAKITTSLRCPGQKKHACRCEFLNHIGPAEGAESKRNPRPPGLIKP